MTVYRRNPLLMTVMGANPGRRYRRNPLDRSEQERIYELAKDYHRDGIEAAQRKQRHGYDGLEACMAELYALGRAADSLLGRQSKLAIEISLLHGDLHEAGAQAGLWPTYSHGHRTPPKAFLPNPFGEAVVAGVTGALVNRAFQSNPEGDPCAFCGGPLMLLGRLGAMTHYRCRNCGIDSHESDAARVRRPRTDPRRRRGVPPPPPRPNPAIRKSWDGLTGRQRLAILEFAGIDEERAIQLSRKSWATLGAIDPDAQRKVTLGWRDSSRTSRRTRDGGTTRIRRHETTVRMNPGPRRRKMTMTVAKFAQWVKSKKDPAMWRAFLAKFKGYEKWTHGAKARKVHLEWVETPGVNGLWITYDGGKQPESTYIMPKGSPRKGAWKHPWDTMPDIKHDPEAKIVITKLRGQSKITDFYHK